MARDKRRAKCDIGITPLPRLRIDPRIQVGGSGRAALPRPAPSIPRFGGGVAAASRAVVRSPLKWPHFAIGVSAGFCIVSNPARMGI